MGTSEQVNKFKRVQPFVEIMDSTLRDGEQTSGVSFLPHEKLMMARMLLNDLNVDRIEVASARVSDGEREAVSMICRYAARIDKLERVEVLGFIDGGKSIDWAAECGCKTVNLLAKGSLKHCTQQLQKTPEEHIEDIHREVKYAHSKGITVNLYLEDWSNGMKDSPSYVYTLMDALCDVGIRRFMLPDTLGIMNPLQCIEYFRKMLKRYPDTHFDFHAHNDYDLAVSNSLAAVLSGAKGLHVTVNGLGERSGNASVAAVVAALSDMMPVKMRIDESKLTHVCKYVESISGIRIPDNEPVVGENVFTQTSGVHADGDRKGSLYANQLLPERFGRVRQYALGKMSGKANIIENLDKLGISLSPEQVKLVTQRVVELGDKKEMMTAEDLPFIVADVLKSGHSSNDNIRIENYSLQLTKGMKPAAMLKVSIDGTEYETSSNGDGQYNAFMKALWKIYDRLGKKHPLLADYQVTIPPGGKTDALVATTIVWNMDGHEFKTRGIDSDQTEAAIKATVKMLNIIENLDLTTLK